MTKQLKTDEQILDAVYESANDLHRSGLIDKKRMLKYEAICLESVPEYDSTKVRALRNRYNLSQYQPVYSPPMGNW